MNSKAKGNGGELELLHILHAHGIPAERNDQRYVSGFCNPDISSTLDGHPLHIEVKRAEKLSIYEAMTQAQVDSNGKAVPIVCHRRNRKPWLVIFRLDDLLHVIEARANREKREVFENEKGVSASSESNTHSR